MTWERIVGSLLMFPLSFLVLRDFVYWGSTAWRHYGIGEDNQMTFFFAMIIVAFGVGVYLNFFV